MNMKATAGDINHRNDISEQGVGAQRPNAKDYLDMRIRNLKRQSEDDMRKAIELEALRGALPTELDVLAERGLWRLLNDAQV